MGNTLDCCLCAGGDAEVQPDGGMHVQQGLVDMREMPPHRARRGPQVVHVVRHGEREDDVNEEWTHLSDRPYDPPLTAEGRMQARRRGEWLADLPEAERPVVVVSSPFLRCLQTAAAIYHELSEGGAVPGKLLVHHQLSEVHEPRVLRCNLRPEFDHAAVEAEVVKMLEALGCEVRDVSVAVNGEPVAYPETRRQALARYSTALHDVLPSRQNCVLVTHGEAVGRAVSLLRPTAEVYEVDFCACVTMSSTDFRQWRLTTSSGEQGVSWTE